MNTDLTVWFTTGVQQAVVFDWEDSYGCDEGGATVRNDLGSDGSIRSSVGATAFGPYAACRYWSDVYLHVFNFSPKAFTLEMPWSMYISGGAWDTGSAISFRSYASAAAEDNYAIQQLARDSVRVMVGDDYREYYDEPGGIFRFTLPPATRDEFFELHPSATNLTFSQEVWAATTITPEPTSLALLGTGLAGLLVAAGKTRRKPND